MEGEGLATPRLAIAFHFGVGALLLGVGSWFLIVNAMAFGHCVSDPMPDSACLGLFLLVFGVLLGGAGVLTGCFMLVGLAKANESDRHRGWLKVCDVVMILTGLFLSTISFADDLDWTGISLGLAISAFGAMGLWTIRRPANKPPPS